MAMSKGAAFISLESYKLSGVTVTDHQLGVGSAAVVVELEYMGHKCAGKKIHNFLLKSGGSNYRSSSRSFSKECHFLSKIQHPNVVQFLGVYFEAPDETIPILVMEFLPINLTSCIEHHGILPQNVGYSLLFDIAQGLLFLHNQKKPIIHRDLSSHNILLSPTLCAKIGDLGVARIINMSPMQVSAMTKKPGTEAYMPPEVMVEEPFYNTSIDEFSYGILTIQIFCGKIPMPQIPVAQMQLNDSNPTLRAFTEAERRKNYLETVGYDHPLMSLILRCIDNVPKKRPSAQELVLNLKEKVENNTLTFRHRLDTIKYVAEKEAEKTNALKKEQENTLEKLKKYQETIQHLSKKISQHKYNRFVPNFGTFVAFLIAIVAIFSSYMYYPNSALSIGVHTQDFINSTMYTCAAEKNIHCDDIVPSMISGLVGNMSWTSGQSLETTFYHGQTVLFEGYMCYGGGIAEKETHKYLVYCYQPRTDTWRTLPNLPVKSFGLGVFNHSLNAIGGINMDGEESKKVYTLVADDSGLYWVNSVIPDMPISRVFPAIATLPSALIVAGGERSIGIYTSETGWYWSNQPLSVPSTDVTLAVTSSICYLLAGNYSKELLQSDWFPHSQYIAIDDLLQDRNKVTPGSAFKNRNELIYPSYRWRQLEGGFTMQANTLVGTVLAGNLITVGMRGQSWNNSVRMYSLSKGSWIQIGVLPEGLHINTITIASFSPSELVVTGRKTGPDGYLSVYISSFTF